MTEPDEPAEDSVEAREEARRRIELRRLGPSRYVEAQVREAMAHGAFDDLPGAGQPLALPAQHDPDWWLKQLIEREQLTGLGPPALLLRVEDAGLDDDLDKLGTEGEVRARLEDFNHRVVDAARQLLGGPPVITPTRDIDAEVNAWRARRSARTLRTPTADAGSERPPRSRKWGLARRLNRRRGRPG